MYDVYIESEGYQYGYFATQTDTIQAVTETDAGDYLCEASSLRRGTVNVKTITLYVA